MKTLIQHIQDLNAKTLAWVAEEPEKRWATTIPEEIEFWNEREIFTVEDFERDGLIGSIWDMYKEVHGIRPRGWNLNEMSLEQLQAIYDDLLIDVKNAAEEDRIREEAAIADFECLIAKMIHHHGAKTRARALKWFIESNYDEYDLMYGGEHICWDLGIPFEKKVEFDEIIKKFSIRGKVKEAA